MDPRQLKQAFQVFSAASSELCGAYEELRRQVSALTRELELANGELERQFAEKQALSQRFVLLLEALPGGVVLVDDEGRVAQANPAAFRMLGEPLIGTAWGTLLRERLQPTELSGEWIRSGSAPALRLSIASRALQGAAAEVLLIQDVSETHAQRESAQRSERLAAMGEMAARLAHRLRTPLATALLYAAQMGSSALPAAARARFADKTVDRLQHLERLIGDMLLFVRGPGAGFEPVAPGSMLREVFNVIEPQAIECGLEIEMMDESDARTLQLDPQALRGALISLAENAVQACRPGDRIGLSAHACERHLDFRVSDTGPGMPPEVQARVFEPFFTTRSAGTGLGLAIVRAVAQAYAGSVSASSEPGKGTEFVLRLPFVRIDSYPASLPNCEARGCA